MVVYSCSVRFVYSLCIVCSTNYTFCNMRKIREMWGLCRVLCIVCIVFCFPLLFTYIYVSDVRAKPYISFLRCFLRFFFRFFFCCFLSFFLHQCAWMVSLHASFMFSLRVWPSCSCGSRRHLRGRTALQADTERIPCCPGALPPVTHSTAFQAGLSCLLFVVDSTKPCSNLLLVLAQQDATLCKCMVGFGEASRVTSYCH